MRKKTTEQFIEEAKSKHGDKYNYSHVIYAGKDNKVIITCKKHGNFEQCANSHLQGYGCKKCACEESSLLQRNNINEFVKKGREKHGDKYDYTKVNYVNTKTKVIIICKEHGEFLQTPGDHYASGCKKCGDILRAENRRYTKEEIIKMSIDVHGNTYNYSKIEYTDRTIQNIECREHGLFSQLKHIHVNLKGGCKKCGDILRGENRKYTKEEIIQLAIDVHGDTYNYSKLEYNGIHNNVTILCKVHGEFLQTPSNHIRGSGCLKCGTERTSEKLKYTKETIIEKAKEVHGDKYDYSKSEYTNVDTKITIVCKTHGEFQQSPYCHINNKNGCPVCASTIRGENRKSNTEEFIKNAIAVHGDKYDYSKVNYIKSVDEIIIICKNHGEFTQRPANHINSSNGCPMCKNKTEGIFYKKMQMSYPFITHQFAPDWIKPKRFDFCIQEHKIIIELDGRQHFKQVSNWSTPEEQFENDKYKEKIANDNGYSTVRILQEDVFYDNYNWLKELCETIQEIKNGKDVVNVYLCENGQYDLH